MNETRCEVARYWTLAQPTVSAYVTSIVCDFRDRDDVLQEIAVSVIDSFESYDPSRPFVAWALGVARNKVRNYLRSRKGDRHVFDSETIEQVADVFAEVSAQSTAISNHLGECIELLDDRSKDLCKLRYQQGLSLSAMSGLVEMSANTIAKALQRIRERLRECVERKARLSEV